MSVTKTWIWLISSEVLIIEHWYFARMILLTSPFNWHHAVTLTFKVQFVTMSRVFQLSKFACLVFLLHKDLNIILIGWMLDVNIQAHGDAYSPRQGSLLAPGLGFMSSPAAWIYRNGVGSLFVHAYDGNSDNKSARNTEISHLYHLIFDDIDVIL